MFAQVTAHFGRAQHETSNCLLTFKGSQVQVLSARQKNRL